MSQVLALSKSKARRKRIKPPEPPDWYIILHIAWWVSVVLRTVRDVLYAFKFLRQQDGLNSVVDTTIDFMSYAIIPTVFMLIKYPAIVVKPRPRWQKFLISSFPVVILVTVSITAMFFKNWMLKGSII